MTQRALAHVETRVELTQREFQLLSLLVSARGDIVTRSEALRHVWGENFDGPPNVVDVYIGYLRDKFGRLGSSTTKISTLRGTGFRLETDGMNKKGS